MTELACPECKELNAPLNLPDHFELVYRCAKCTLMWAVPKDGDIRDKQNFIKCWTF